MAGLEKASGLSRNGPLYPVYWQYRFATVWKPYAFDVSCYSNKCLLAICKFGLNDVNDSIKSRNCKLLDALALLNDFLPFLLLVCT